jgi:hypothetical protein
VGRVRHPGKVRDLGEATWPVLAEPDPRPPQRARPAAAALALHPKGLTADQLALLLYGERGNPATVRAGVHRLRAQLGGVLLTRPPDAPVVREERADLAATVRKGAMDSCHALVSSRLRRALE